MQVSGPHVYGKSYIWHRAHIVHFLKIHGSVCVCVLQYDRPFHTEKYYIFLY